MKPFRKHVAIAIDGGGIRGVIVTKALEAVEDALGQRLGEIAELAAGTSTGSVIASGIALNLSASEMTGMYRYFAPKVFGKSLRYYLWPLLNHRYSNAVLKSELDRQTGNKRMGDLWTNARKFDLIVTTRDLHEARTRFIKSWKPEYRKMPITTAVLASSAAPTYFPVIEGRFIDGGVGSFGNPCFLAAYEARLVLGWKPEETTLISLGTGRLKQGIAGLPLHAPDRLISFQWLPVIFDTFITDSNDQQARVVKQFFDGLDFRRFQVPIERIELDDISAIDRLLAYGETLGKMMLADQTDPELDLPVYQIAQDGGAARS
ncbi:MAG: patatin-like phospholipase family protein [Acidobacteriota bacterium]